MLKDYLQKDLTMETSDMTKAELTIKKWRQDFKGTRSEKAHFKYTRWCKTRQILRRYHVNTVLEFGSGVSTILFNGLRLDVDSYETDAEYMEQVRRRCPPDVRFHIWDNKHLELNKHYDLCFVDGEAPRTAQLELAKKHADIVIVDDRTATSTLSEWTPIDCDGEIMHAFLRPGLKPWPAVSVIIGHRHDFPMLGITVRSVLEELRYVPGGGEVIIVDNSNKSYRHLIDSVIDGSFINAGRVKIIYQDFPSVATARNTAADAALAPYILSLDSHMLCGRDMINDLINFLDSFTGKNLGFVHAPLVMVQQGDEKERHEFKIRTKLREPGLVGLKGMPWICTKTFWNDIRGYGFISDHKMAWGGAEVYLAIKPWIMGYDSYGIPCRPGIHIGPYRNMKDFYRYRSWGRSGNHGLYSALIVASFVLGEKSIPNRITKLSPGASNWTNDFWPKAIELGKAEKAWLDKRTVRSVDSYFNTFSHLKNV